VGVREAPACAAWRPPGQRGAVDDLGELGSAIIGLAGAQGARIRASFAVRADTPHPPRITETEAGVIATQLAVLMPALLLMLAVQFACGPGNAVL